MGGREGGGGTVLQGYFTGKIHCYAFPIRIFTNLQRSKKAAEIQTQYPVMLLVNQQQMVSIQQILSKVTVFTRYP
jgi:hypothetical protein